MTLDWSGIKPNMADLAWFTFLPQKFGRPTSFCSTGGFTGSGHIVPDILWLRLSVTDTLLLQTFCYHPFVPGRIVPAVILWRAHIMLFIFICGLVTIRILVQHVHVTKPLVTSRPCHNNILAQSVCNNMSGHNMAGTICPRTVCETQGCK